LQVNRYGTFQLTEAIRPALDLRVVPSQGYRRELYRDDAEGLAVPVLIAAVSAESLFDVFLDLLYPFGDVVDVVVETSHDSPTGEQMALSRQHIDLPVLKSVLVEFEELLLNDGCTGISVLSPSRPMELQFDEHKLLIVYAHKLLPFERVLRRAGVHRNDKLKLLTEAEHLHSTEPHHYDLFQEMCCRLGTSEPAEWGENSHR